MTREVLYVTRMRHETVFFFWVEEMMKKGNGKSCTRWSSAVVCMVDRQLWRTFNPHYR